MSYPIQPFGFMVGYCGKTFAQILVCSLYPGDFKVNGVTVQTTAIGTSGTRPAGISQAGYVGNVTLGGLQPGKNYGLTVSQGSTTLNGTIRTLPESGDFSIIAGTCDAPHGAGGTPNGAYSAMRQMIEESPLRVVGIGFPDDDVYCDNIKINDSVTSGHYTDNPTSSVRSEYARALAYLNKFGLFGDTGQTNLAQAATKHPDYLWCLRNVPWWIQQGDHTYVNNLGWWDSSEAVASTSSAWWTEARTCWEAFNGPLMPPRLANLDTDAEHWGFSIADEVFVFSQDRIRNGNALRDRDGLSAGVCLGSNQIDDILAALGGTESFKVFLSTICTGMITPLPAVGVTSPGYTSAQQPFAEEMVAEYRRLFTAPTTGMQALAAANNFQFVVLTGDYHGASVCRFQRSAGGGQLDESFIEVRLGSVRNSKRSMDPEGRGWVTGYVNNGRSTDWREGGTVTGTPSATMSFFAKLDFYNTETPKRRDIRMYDSSLNVVWKGRWLQGENGNLPINSSGRIA